MLKPLTRTLCIVATASCIALGAAIKVHWSSTDQQSAEALLTRADDLAWNNQWLAAAPLYLKAENLFVQEHRPAEALYAHVSQFIPKAESESLPGLIVELQDDLKTPEAQVPKTRLRILLMEGMIETNYDASMARTTWELVHTAARQQHQYRLMLRAEGEEGIAAYLLGDLSKAKQLVTRAWLASKISNDAAAHVRYASVYGAGLVEMQRYDEAMRVLSEATGIAEQSNGVAYPSIATSSKIDALRGLRRYGEALALADDAITRLPSANLDAHLFQILTAKGEIYGDLNRWDDAAKQYDLSLRYARHLGYWRGIVQTGALAARAYEHLGRLDQALQSIDEAINANARLPEELYFSPGNLAIKAEILHAMGRVRASDELYRRSARLVDNLLATAPTPNVERELITQLQQVYVGYFESLSGEGNLPAAFKAIEMARGRVEMEALRDHPPITPHPPTSQEQSITALNLKLLETSAEGDRSHIEEALYDTELQMEASPPGDATYRPPIALKDVQHNLGQQEVLLEYVLGDPTSSVLAITSGGVHRYALPSEKMIEAQVSSYRRTITRKGTDRALAQALFNDLLSPIREYRDRTRVIVVPDGALHLLPFSALMDRGNFTIADHTFSVTPSATVLYLLRHRSIVDAPDSIRYLGIAAWTETQAEEQPEARNVALTTLPPPLEVLPQSKEEVESIAKEFRGGTMLLIGPEATETRFKQLHLERYRVLHFALHALANIEYPDRSALIFAPEREGKDDGMLEVREVRDLNLNAQLVTLSACDTGVGPVGESDVANMANAFIEAGAESVVSSLWNLEDKTTSMMMIKFYAELVNKHDKVEALRLAQLQIQLAGLPPYYWAGVQIAGNPTGTIQE